LFGGLVAPGSHYPVQREGVSTLPNSIFALSIEAILSRGAGELVFYISFSRAFSLPRSPDLRDGPPGFDLFLGFSFCFFFLSDLGLGFLQTIGLAFFPQFF